MLAIRRQSNMTPLPKLVSEVFAVAKQDRYPGDRLDGIGGCTFYSLIDHYDIAQRERLIPVGLAKDARVMQPIATDTPITYDHVQLNEASTVFKLRRLQDQWITGEIEEHDLLGMVDEIAGE